MAAKGFATWISQELDTLRDNNLFKVERVITGPEGPVITTADGSMLNFCANDYLGLANHPELVAAAAKGLRTHGFGMASVRFICGTQDLHKALEERIAAFIGTEDAILYNSCFDANAGLFETLFDSRDAIISDALNHASIIDGIRLSKAQRHVYRHADMADLEVKLRETADVRFRLIATDGVFSMQGDLAPLPEICDLAERYDALVMVDDSHATGFLGPSGRGTPDHFGLTDRIDLLTSTLGKALGGATGGFTAGRGSVVDYLRQRSRPYLFSNTLAPPIAAATLAALDLVERQPDLRETLLVNTSLFRQAITSLGFTIVPGIHPIVPIMIGDEGQTMALARAANERGLFVVGFSHPVVPRGEARIRVQLSAAHTRDQINQALSIFAEVGKDLGII